VLLDGSTVTIDRLELSDPFVFGHLAAIDPAARADEVTAALAVGIRGLGAMGSGATAQRVGDVVERLVGAAFSRTEQRVGELLEASRSEMSKALDPDVRSSITARTLAELTTMHRDLLDGIDPDRRDSRTARFVAELDGLLGPSGHLERRLGEALDPTTGNSALASIFQGFEQRFQELRDLIVGSEARSEEAGRGTAKGFDFEDLIEARLRAEARHLGGAVVERTSMETGSMGSAALVGDFVLTLPDATRVVIEAKHTSRITLAGKGGILDELDRAMTNRTATWAVCVSHDDAFPDEVGGFGVYGNRVLVVDDGTGDLIRVALRWIAAASRHAASQEPGLDRAALLDQLDRLRGLATRFSRVKRGLGAVQSSVEAVRCELDELRTELLDDVDDIHVTMHRADPATATPMVA